MQGTPMAGTIRIATAHASFNCICQVTSICTASYAWLLGHTWVNSSNGIWVNQPVLEGSWMWPKHEQTMY